MTEREKIGPVFFCRPSFCRTSALKNSSAKLLGVVRIQIVTVAGAQTCCALFFIRTHVGAASLRPCYETSLYDEWGVTRKDFGLAEIFGVSFAGRNEGPMRNAYLRLEHDAAPGHGLLRGLEDAPRIIHGVSRVEVPATAKFPAPLLTHIPSYPDLPMEKVFPKTPRTDLPQVFLREVGAGRVAYFPWDIARIVSAPRASARKCARIPRSVILNVAENRRRNLFSGAKSHAVPPAPLCFTSNVVMNSILSIRVLLPLLSFVVAFAGSAGLTLSAADSKTERKANRKASAPAAEKKSATTDVASDEKRPPLKINVDTTPIDRDAPDRVSYAPIVKRTASSVVYVHSTKTVKGQDFSSFFNDPMFRRFFENPGAPLPDDDERSLRPDNKGKSPRITPTPKGNNRNRGGNGNGGGTTPRGRMPDQTQQGLGSGVVITADGYILTNNHVVEGADDVKVSIGESNKRYEAKIVGRDPGSDLAVLKIDASGLSPATFGDSDQVLVGDVVLAIGNPFGVGQSVSRGIVSALSRGMGMGTFEDFIQTDAAINPGNSGGALLDSSGRVIGINSAILSRSGGFAGVGFAIPINLVRSVAEQIVNHGRVERGYLGVRPQELTEELAEQFGTEKGALLREVTDGSPADKAGIKSGDVITKVNATEIRDARHLLMTVSQIAPGTEVAVDYLRDGKPGRTQVKLARRDEEAIAGIDAGALKKDEGVLNGVGVGEITAEIRTQLQIPARVRGAIVTSIEADSPAAKQGLREGDVILELDRKPVTDVEQAVKLSEEIKGPKVLVLIWRAGQRRYLAIDESK
ncbi:MAG: Do family serine endopeptidase [Opitutus sp.]|nr:Do family serine endopeptidase [Opitutus sp.]